MTKQEADLARAYFLSLGREMTAGLPTSRAVFYPNTREEQLIQEQATLAIPRRGAP
jgi:hypothetical protein